MKYFSKTLKERRKNEKSNFVKYKREFMWKVYIYKQRRIV